MVVARSVLLLIAAPDRRLTRMPSLAISTIDARLTPRFFIENGQFALKSGLPSTAKRLGTGFPLGDVTRMFAVIKAGGKQYSVAADDVITVTTIPGSPGDGVLFDNVLMLVDGEDTKFGAPFLTGASVTGTIVDHKRGPKVYAFTKRRRKNSKRKRGHRQDLTVVKITGVSPGDGKKNEA